MGQVIFCNGAARDPKIHNLFQIADGDSGVIRWVNADLVTHILPATDKRNPLIVWLHLRPELSNAVTHQQAHNATNRTCLQLLSFFWAHLACEHQCCCVDGGFSPFLGTAFYAGQQCLCI